MADDNKTNEELLEEVKKLRKLEEKRDKGLVGRNEPLAWVISIIIVVPMLFFLIFLFA